MCAIIKESILGEEALDVNFRDLLGNDALKAGLSAACRADRFSHFYLISGPRGSGKHTLARILAAAMLCTGEGDRPCGQCPACRKVLSGNHPDFITVDDPEKKTIPVELIRQTREDLFIRPNEGRRKIYLLPRGQDLGLPGQNALLKVLEEPPAYGVFLLLADNPDRLLPTVRSRCVELHMQPLPGELALPRLQSLCPGKDRAEYEGALARSGGFLGQAIDLLREGGGWLPQTAGFVRAFAGRDPVALLQVLCPMEKLKRDGLIEVLEQWRGLLIAALAARSGLPGGQWAEELAHSRRAGELAQAAESLAQAAEYARGNVSPGAICGALSWQLR